MPYNEQIFVVDKDDETTTTKYIPRETLRRVSTPQAYRFDLLDSKYHEAFEKKMGIYGSHYTNTMMVELGVRLHFAAGSDKNIKLITTNIIGVQNLLEFAVKHNASRFAFASSNEIYGENRGDTEKFDERYCGYIDCNTMRAGYPESKRCGEALCQAYKVQKKLDIVIPRLTRSYGPTLLKTDRMIYES